MVVERKKVNPFQMPSFKYFKPEEFKRATPACSIEDMDLWFLQKLDKAREIAGIPFVINSAFRSPEYEKSKGRAGTSAHTLGLAVDLKCTDSYARLKIVNALLQAGFTRIGLHERYIHVDDSWFHIDNVLWLYDNEVSEKKEGAI